MTAEELKAIAERCERDDEKWGGVGLSYPDVFQMMGDRRHLLTEVERLRGELHDSNAERAHYGDIVTSKLGALENEIGRLREEVERLEQVSSAEADDSLYFREELETLRETQAGQIESALAIKDGYIERLHAAVAEVERLREAQRWIPVSERTPDPTSKESILLATMWGSVFPGCYDDGGWYSGSARIAGVTHWMPLPTPPEVQP